MTCTPSKPCIDKDWCEDMRPCKYEAQKQPSDKRIHPRATQVQAWREYMTGDQVKSPEIWKMTADELCDLAMCGLDASAIEESTDSAGDWQCKDYADGWITFPTRKAAEKYQQDTGALMRYRRFYAATDSRDRDA